MGKRALISEQYTHADDGDEADGTAFTWFVPPPCKLAEAGAADVALLAAGLN